MLTSNFVLYLQIPYSPPSFFEKEATSLLFLPLNSVLYVHGSPFDLISFYYEELFLTLNHFQPSQWTTDLKTWQLGQGLRTQYPSMPHLWEYTGILLMLNNYKYNYTDN